VVVLVGIVLLIWPTGEREGQKTSVVPEKKEAEELRELEEQMEAILSSMSGVGQVQVLLTLESDGEKQLAQDAELEYSGNTAAPTDYSKRSEPILVEGDCGEETVVVKRIFPTYRGALIVCQGGGNPEVQLIVTQAVMSLTGLSADRITVAKWQ
jgi:stage III sporulation protein AG